MTFVWCLLVTICIGICFKLFGRWKVNTFNAIVINYTVCLLLGSFLDPDASFPFSPKIIQTPWFKYDIILGLLFISGFNLTAVAIQKAGITLTTMMQRMSLITTVSFTVLVFHERFGWFAFCGLLSALMAIIAINQTGTSISLQKPGKYTPLLFLVLLLSSAIEIILFFMEKSGLVGEHQMAFTTHGFGCAAIIGWIMMGWLWIKRNNTIARNDIFAGILLGIPNYFSIYLILVMLNQGWKGSIMYPMLNVSVLLLSTIIAVIAFREKLNRLNWIGIGLATLSILTIAYAQNEDTWKITF
jgi:drug/metabolite transporter (DMT)-like permease